jgi:hypothetical protein
VAIKVGTFSAASGGVSGLPFTPKFVLVFSTFQDGFGAFVGGEQYLTIGYSRGGGGTNQRTVSFASGWDALAFFKPHGRDGTRLDEVISDITLSIVTVNIGGLVFTADGFTVSFSLTPNGALDYGYVAIGGDDVVVAMGTASTPAVPGEVTYSGLGITPDLLWMLTFGTNQGGGTGAHWSQGFVDSAGRQRVSAIHSYGNRTGAAPPGDTDRYQSETECMVVLDHTTGAKLGAAEFVSKAADQFVADWTSVPGYAASIFYIAFEGVLGHLGTLTQRATPGISEVTDIEVVPEVVLFQSVQLTAAETGLRDKLRIMVGAGQPGAQYCAVGGDEDAVAAWNLAANYRGQWNDAAVLLSDVGTGVVGKAAVTDMGNRLGSGGFFELTWSATDGGARQVYWLALSLSPATVDVDEDTFSLGGALQGFEGPLLWVEFHHPELDDVFVIAPILLADPTTYYYGLKRVRVLRVDQVQLALADRAGAPQANRFSFTMCDYVESEDAAPTIRGWLGRVNQRAVRRVEIIARMITDRDRRRLLEPFTIFRGRLDEVAAVGDGFETQIDCVSWAEQRFADPVLDVTVEEVFPEAPVEQRQLLLPLALGILSDEASGEGAPELLEDEAGRGSVIGADPQAGYGDITAVAAPTSVAAVEVPAGGNINLGVAPGNVVYVWATRVVGGVEGEAEPFLPANAVAVPITADGAAVEATCDNDGADAYRFYIARSYFGIKAVHFIETTDPVTGVVFDEFPALGTEAPISTGGEIHRNRQAWASVLAMLPTGRTEASARVYILSTGHARPNRFAWEAVPDALWYEVYWGDHPTAEFQRRYIVEVDQLNLNGDPYWEGDWSLTGFDLVDGMPVPVGKIIPRYVGLVTDLEGFEWGGFVMSIRPGAAFVRAYMGGVPIEEGRYGVDIAAPGKTGYATYFGADPFWTVGDYRLFMIFLRGPLLEQALQSSIPGEDLPAGSASARVGSGDSEVLITVDEPGEAGNDYTVAVVDGVGASQPLLASLTGGTALVVSLATDGAGAPDAAANTGVKVAQAIAAVAGLSAGITGAGTDPVAAQAVTGFSGGSEENQIPGVDYSGEFRVNFAGCDIDDDGTGGCITDIFDQLQWLLLHLLCKDEPSLAGAWDAAMPAFADGSPRINGPSFTQAKADHAELVPSGRKGARWIATDITWADLIAEWSVSAAARTTIAEDGSFSVGVRNPFGDVVAHVGPMLEILRGSFRWRESSRGFFTRTPYRYRPIYDADGQVDFGDVGRIISAAAEAEFKERPEDQSQDYVWRDAPGPARQLARAMNDATRWPGREIEAASVLHWLHHPIGRNIALTHPEGPHATGFEGRALYIVGKSIAPDGCTVTLRLEDLRVGEDALSFFEYEEFMAGRWIGGSREDSNQTVDAIVRPMGWHRFRIDWDEIPESHGQQARVSVKRTGAGNIKPAIFLDGEDPSGDTAVVEGTNHASSAWGEQVLEIPRPDAGGEVFYWLLPVLSGGALDNDTYMFGQLEGYRVA